MIDPALMDNDVLRFALVLSLTLSFVVYTRFRLVSGGSVTGGFIAALVLLGDWFLIPWVVGLAILGAAATRFVVLRLIALPKPMVFYGTVLTSAILGAIAVGIIELTPAAPTSPWGVVAAYGVLVSPGLLAYDFLTQRTLPTLGAVALVALATVLVTLPIVLLTADLPSGYSTTFTDLASRLDVGQLVVASIAAIAFGMALRLSAGLRTGGFLGAMFLVQMLTWQTLATIAAGAIATALVVRFACRFVVLTPRQKAQVSMVLGSLVSWAGLYWFTAFGWDPAIAANSLAIAPLLAVGLVAADMGRPGSGIGSTLIGTGISAVLILAAVSIVPSGGVASGLAVTAVIAGLVAAPGMLRLRAQQRRLVDEVRGLAGAAPVVPPAR